MSRYIANTAAIAKLETTPGVDAAPTGAADCVIVMSDVDITPVDLTMVDPKLMSGYLGASQMLVGTGAAKSKYTVLMGGSGTAGTAPPWGKLLLACACAEATLSTPARIEYTPVSTSMQSLTQYIYDDGVLHKQLLCMGAFKLSALINDVAKLMFDWLSLDGGITAASTPSLTKTAWKIPPVLKKSNVVDITIGCTYAAGALTGGTTYVTTGITMDVGNKPEFIAFLSDETVDITDRSANGGLEMRLTAAQEVTFQNQVKAGTTVSVGLTLGTAGGNKIILFFPAVQFTKPAKKNKQGIRTLGYDLVFVPVAGNDEFLICVL